MPAPRRIRGEVSGPGRAAEGAVGAEAAKAAVRRPSAGTREPRCPLVIREGNLVTEGDDLLGGGCRGFAPNADSASLTVLKVQVGAEHISTHSGYAVVMADRVRRRRCLALGRGGGCRGRATGIRMRPGRRR